MAKTDKKNKATKKTKAKKRGRRFRRVFDMELAYKIINTVQESNEAYKIRLMDVSIAPILENLITDAQLEFEKSEEVDSIMYKISPGDVEFCKEIEVDELQDEFLEDGQLFN